MVNIQWVMNFLVYIAIKRYKTKSSNAGTRVKKCDFLNNNFFQFVA